MRNCCRFSAPTLALCAKNIDLASELRRDAFVDRQLSLPNRTALVCELNERIQAGREKGQCLVVLHPTSLLP